MSQEGINLVTLKATAKAALQEARLNGIDGLRGSEAETEQADLLLGMIDGLIAIVNRANEQQQPEALEGEVVDGN